MFPEQWKGGFISDPQLCVYEKEKDLVFLVYELIAP